jgi:hypothetical protein
MLAVALGSALRKSTAPGGTPLPAAQMSASSFAAIASAKISADTLTPELRHANFKFGKHDHDALR